MAKLAAVHPLFPASDTPASTSARRSTPPPISGVIALTTDHADATGYVISGDAGDTVNLSFPDLGIAGRIVRFNPVAMWFESDDVPPLNQPVEATLEWDGGVIGPLYGRVVPSKTGDKEWCYQIELRNLDFDMASAMMAMVDVLLSRGSADYPPSSSICHEDITDPERIRKILLALSVMSQNGTLYGGADPLPVKLLDIGAESIDWEIERSETVRPGPCAIEIVGYNSLYSLQFDTSEVVDGLLVTGNPTQVRRVRRRILRRCTLQEPTTLRFLHPRWVGEGLCTREIRDVSFAGLSFHVDITKDVLFPGLRIPLMTIPHGADYLRLSGVVRSLTRSADGTYICGVSVAPWAPDDEVPWIRFVAAQLSPNTQTSENVLEALWELFERSGYFSLAGKQPEDFAELRESFFLLGRRAPELSHLICQAVWPSERGVEGTVSFTKAYSTSWMGHQLAKRVGKGPASCSDQGQILRDVYTRTFEHPQADRSFAWVVCYVEPSVRWIERSHLGFAARHRTTEDVFAERIHFMSVRCDQQSVPTPNVVVERATPKERLHLAALLQERKPRPYYEALDFTPDTISMETIADQWRHAGLERERAIFIARSGGVPLAYGIFESGQLGTNLFRLLDSVRIIPLAPAPSAHAALIDAARQWFLARGRSEFLYLREDADTSYVEAARLHEDSEPCLWIIAARHVPEFLEHIVEVTGPRDRRPPTEESPVSLRPTEQRR